MAAPSRMNQLHICIAVLVSCLAVFPQTAAGSEIVTVSATELENLVSINPFVLVYYHTHDCPDCIRAEEQLQMVAGEFHEEDLTVVQSDDIRQAFNYNIRIIPGLLFFRNGLPTIYTESPIDAEGLLFWLEQSREPSTKVLSEDNFEHDTQAATGATTGDWFVLFHEPKCAENTIATWEVVGSRLKNKVIVARVDTELNGKLKERFKIKACPTYIFFHHGKMYTYDLDIKDAKSLVSFAEGWYTNTQAVPVPKEPTPFDTLTETIAEELKKATAGNDWLMLVLFAAAVLLPLLALCCCWFVISSNKQKAE